MTKTFSNLDDEKQRRILNAALEEFAEQGYKQASTNQIVKRAGIGKGMIFYYFKSKKDLYLYLLDYSLNIIKNEYLIQIDTEEPDFIERLKQAGEIKLQTQMKHPSVFNFMGTLVLADDAEIPEKSQKRLQELQELGDSKLYCNIDKSLFRDDVDTDKAFNLISWSIEGYQNHLKRKLKGESLSSIDLDSYWREFYDYLDVLKTLFYR